MAKKKQTTEDFDAKGDLILQLQALKRHAGWLYLAQIIEAWKNQVLNEILTQEKSDKAKGEFTAYGRILNLPERLVSDLQNSALEINLDAYKKE